jgi:hypothetical protein
MNYKIIAFVQSWRITLFKEMKCKQPMFLLLKGNPCVLCIKGKTCKINVNQLSKTECFMQKINSASKIGRIKE